MGFEMRGGGDLRKRPRISECNEENIGFFIWKVSHYSKDWACSISFIPLFPVSLTNSLLHFFFFFFFCESHPPTPRLSI